MSVDEHRDRLLRELGDAAACLKEHITDEDEYQRRIVEILRANGATWEDIGEAVGTSKQAAWERFA